jgi:hypothetical protein
MDDRIKQFIGLSDNDTNDLLQKYYRFVNSLNPAQQGVIRACMPSFDQAATAIGGGTSASDIHQFVSSRLSGPTAQAIPITTTEQTARSIAPPAENPATAIPVPTQQAATAIPVPTAQSAAGIPVPNNKSK